MLIIRPGASEKLTYLFFLSSKVATWHIFGLGWIALSIFEMRRVIIHSASAEFRRLLRGLLVDADCNIEHIASREALLDACRDMQCDLIMTDDVRMFQSGDDVACALQRVHLPRIVLLSHDASEDTVLALLEGCVSRYVVLPCEPSRLRRMAMQCIE